MNHPNESKHLAPWKGAGLMLSYWCSARCRFCYVCAGPQQTFWAEPQQLVRWWTGLQAIARRDSRDAKIHLTGGDPFGRPDRLFETLQLARRAGLPAPEKVETNAFWAADESITREHLLRLKELGVPLIVTDADVFHQEFVPFDNVRRLVTLGREILGETGVRVRWWDFYHQHESSGLDLTALSEAELLDRQADALATGRDRLTGRAAILAAQFFEGKPADAFDHQPCDKAILHGKGVHVDPYGNIFPDVCCGLVLGNAVNEDIDAIHDWLAANGPTGPIFDALLSRGPCGLIDLATRYGWTPLPDGYLTKCQLCYHLRHHLVRADQCRKWLGPAECYAEPFTNPPHE